MILIFRTLYPHSIRIPYQVHRTFDWAWNECEVWSHRRLNCRRQDAPGGNITQIFDFIQQQTPSRFRDLELKRHSDLGRTLQKDSLCTSLLIPSQSLTCISCWAYQDPGLIRRCLRSNPWWPCFYCGYMHSRLLVIFSFTFVLWNLLAIHGQLEMTEILSHSEGSPPYRHISASSQSITCKPNICEHQRYCGEIYTYM